MEKVNLLQCNPTTLKYTRTTCLPIEMLNRIRESWNTRYPNNPIAATDNKEKLWKSIRKSLKNQYNCETEYCAIKTMSDDNELQGLKYFRPEKPDSWKKNPREWHDSISLTRVMEQYESSNPNFEFIGPAPIDFDDREKSNILGNCILDELCKLDLMEMNRNGTNYIGIIFNLDPHDKPGSHWVCAFIDINKKSAYYYDSYGMKPCTQISKLLHRCFDQGCHTVIWNDIRHQRKDSECGTYCLYTIISLLNGKTFTDICKNRIDDDTIQSTRDLLFATEVPSETAKRTATNHF